MDVVGLGALNFDVLYIVERIARGGEEVGVMDVKSAAGGSAANTIVGLARLGLDVGFIGVVGNDREGEFILEEFRRENVDVSRIKVVEGPTGRAMSFVDASGERALYILPGVNDALRLEDIDLEYVNGAKILHTSSFVSREQLEMQKALARRLRARLSFSPGMLCFKFGLDGILELVERSDFLFLSFEELEALVRGRLRAGGGAKEGLAERGAALLVDLGASVVSVTLGSLGCYVTDGEKRHLVRAYPVGGVVDTTGAGDAFVAGFLYGVLSGRSLEDCGKLGNIAAAFCIREYGCRKGLPSREQLEAAFSKFAAE
ncbi:MAG: carbohydrate kinase family protein [Candidatus Alkanophagales archaeon]